MADNTRNLHPNTVAFHCLEPEVATLINDVIHALACSLHWRQVSKSLLIEVLSRLAESASFEQTHEDFSAALWPHLNDSARKEKFSKWLKRMKEDMELSKCFPVRVVSRRPAKDAKGQWRNHPTLYTPGHFWLLFRAVQDAALKCDLLSFSVRKRRAQVRAIVAAWLTEVGAETIVREKKEKEAAKSASLPCRCRCSNCQKCAAKSATASEARGASRRVDELRRKPNESFSAELDAFSDRYYQHLCGLGEIGKEFRYEIKHVLHAMETAENRAREMITTENKREGVRQYIKLVGGQPK